MGLWPLQNACLAEEHRICAGSHGFLRRSRQLHHHHHRFRQDPRRGCRGDAPHPAPGQKLFMQVIAEGIDGMMADARTVSSLAGLIPRAPASFMAIALFISLSACSCQSVRSARKASILSNASRATSSVRSDPTKQCGISRPRSASGSMSSCVTSASESAASMALISL